MLSISKEELVARFLVKEFMAGRHIGVALKARKKAIEWHGKRKRDDGSPYFVHPNELVYILILLGITDEDMIAAAFLHDVEEEEKISQEEIEREINKVVAYLVGGMTKREKMDWKELEKYFRGLACDIRLVILKTIDRYVNMRRSMFGVFNEERMERYILETEEFILPISEHIIEENAYPEYENQLRLLRSFIKGILEAAKNHVELMEIKSQQVAKEAQ